MIIQQLKSQYYYQPSYQARRGDGKAAAGRMPGNRAFRLAVRRVVGPESAPAPHLFNPQKITLKPR
ncbi:hypothetical protein DCC81_01855 [Chitinophaga parva]|uniref:Uncharacterized protein n=1 Tax=Chitinophaga parva TaxID=2169414 RepID=A0A2T7BKP8_9BACT|nr:hypothetical protein DCC81_01855 [Chitinophaga parva]